jgi:hypothetical protein
MSEMVKYALALLLDNAALIDRLAQLILAGRISDADAVPELQRIARLARSGVEMFQELPSVEADLVQVDDPVIDFSRPPRQDGG